MKKLALLLANVSIICAMAFSMVACNENKEFSTGSSTEAPPSPPVSVSDVFINTAITADSPYAKECDEKGALEEVTYQTRAYILEDGEEQIPTEKTLVVYTPFGYNENDQYNVLFLLKARDDDQGYWFAEGEAYDKDNKVKYAPAGNITQNVVDNLIKNGTVDPLIVVCVDYYSTETADADALIYYNELRNDILPFIQQHYSTYAETATDEGFAASREHFGALGFSLGSRCIYESFWGHCLDCFSYFGCVSEGALDSSVSLILEEMTTGEFNGLDIGFYYAAAGEWDTRIQNVEPTYNSLLQGLSAELREGDNVSDGDNCWFNRHLEGGHEYRCWVADLYNCLQVFFK